MKRFLVKIIQIFLFLFGLFHLSFANGLGFNYLTLNNKHTFHETLPSSSEYYIQYNGFNYHLGLMTGYIIMMMFGYMMAFFYLLVKKNNGTIQKSSPQLVQSVYYCQLKQLVHLNEIFNYLELDNYGIEKITYGFYVRNNNFKRSKSKFTSRLIIVMKPLNDNIIKYCITRTGSVVVYGCKNDDLFLKSLSQLRHILEYGNCIVINNKYINVQFIDHPLYIFDVKCQKIMQFNVGHRINVKKLASSLKFNFEPLHIQNYENKKSHIWINFKINKNIIGSAQIYFNGDVYYLIRTQSHLVSKATSDLFKIISEIISNIN